MREPTFLILTALACEAMHGYGIIGEVARLSEGRLSMRPGTLYGALDRLGDEGLIETDREEVVDGRLRRYYRLTDAGGGALAAEVERLRRNVTAASERLRARAGRSSIPTAPDRKPAAPVTPPAVTAPRLRPAGGVA